MRVSLKWLLATSVFTLAACQTDTRPPLAPEPGGTPAANGTMAGDGSVRVNVALARGVPASRVASEAEALGAIIYRIYENIGGFSATVTEEQRKALEGLPGVAAVSDDRISETHLDASLPVIGANVTRASGFTGAGRVVAVLDNGYDRDHPFIAGRVLVEACFSAPTSGDVTSLCANGLTAAAGAGSASLNITACQNGDANLCRHGQHVAGIVAGNGSADPTAPVAGVAPEASLVLVQVFHRQESSCGSRPAPCTLAFDADIIAGLDLVLGLRATLPIDAVNLSLGGGQFDAVCDAQSVAMSLSMASVRAAGVMPVVASGNNGYLNSIAYPSCISTALSVGNTNNDDVINNTSNRGDLLDIFAPGTGITSSIQGGQYGALTGTSMAAPHVAGAFAVLKQRFPADNIEQLLTRMLVSGKPITYNDGDNTTPRLDLALAAGVEAQPPTVTVNDASVSVPEGTLATNGGTLADPYGGTATLTASRGTVVVNGGGWSWSEPTTNNGPAYPVTLTATSSLGVSTTASFTVSVTNVAPTLTLNPAQVRTGEELTTIPISATFSDPGRLDTHVATVQCYSGSYGTLQQPATITTATENGVLNGTISSPGCPYGDNGTFTASITVRDNDGGEDAETFVVTISNVAPVVSILGDNSTIINGVPVVLTNVGQPTAFNGRVIDRGSDDLFLTWSWNDGTAPATLTSFNASPNADGTPSPSVNAREVTDQRLKLFTAACLRTVSFSAEDDDGGTSSKNIAVIVAGNSGRARSSGYWQTQYRNTRSSPVGQAALECYLQIANQLSSVFSERRAATSLTQAGAILQNSGGGGDASRILDQQLLAAWINFADGAWRWDTMVDTNGDGTADRTFGEAITAAESVRTNPAATRVQLEAQKNILERLNLSYGG